MEKLPLVLPDFLEENEEEDIHERMLDEIPNKYDETEGSLVWDMTRPSAMEIAQINEFSLPVMISIMFPQFAEGIYLDYHGRSVGVFRRQPTFANGFITIEAAIDTFIPTGTTVTTDEVDGVTIEFRTTKDATVDSVEVARVPVEAIEPGASGNVPTDSIHNFLTPVVGVKSLTNLAKTQNGYDEESDDEYRGRIVQSNRTQSFTGNKADYISWAKDIEGVGQVVVVPEWNGPGTVKVLIATTEGTIAPTEMIDAVQSSIAPDGRDGGGLAPIGAKVTVDSIEGKKINAAITNLKISEDYEQINVLDDIKKGLSDYLATVGQDEMVVYLKVSSIVVSTPGVLDYDSLKVNNGTSNIQLENGEVAVVGEVSVL